MTTFRPLWEAKPDAFDGLRRVIMAGYSRDGVIYPKVGEAFWGSPDGRACRWIWAGGGDVINALGFMDLPDFPIKEENNHYVVGRNI